MPKKPPLPTTYTEQLLSELDELEGACREVLEASAVRARQLSGPNWIVAAHPFAWVPSTPELEARRMSLLRDLRDWAPRFRLLFPHPTPSVRKRLDDGIGLMNDWLARDGKAKHKAPAAPSAGAGAAG